MLIDYHSLLIALSFSGMTALVAILVSWLNARRDRYLLFTAMGLGLISIGLIMMGLRNGRFDLVTLFWPFSTILVGLSFAYAGTRFFLHKNGVRTPALVGLAALTVFNVPLLMGYWGLAFFAINAGVATITFLCAREYWNAKHDLRGAALTNVALFMTMAVSYALNAVAVGLAGDWVNYPVNDSWFDNLNAITSLIGITGVGAMTLTLHFSRLAHRHHTEASTDSLTGVLNRRGLFERYVETAEIPGLAVLLFDLDFFKLINDKLGHAQGDLTLKTFTEVVEAQLGDTDLIARIGGEEFCVILPGQGRRQAMATAERLRRAFADAALPSGRGEASATVSVGLATGGQGEPFRSVLGRADSALYKAKSAGRNTLHFDEASRAA